MQEVIREALRYLGVHGEPDASLLAQLSRLSSELSAHIIPRRIWKVLPLRREDSSLYLGDILLPGRSAAHMLGDCEQCAVLICTLGVAFDTWLRRLQTRDMAQAVMLDALGSACIEAVCDSAELEISERFPQHYRTDRFSPGYGDLPLDIQPRLLEAAEGSRIGVTLTPSLLMIPQKSVTALIGIADRPQAARIRGCAHCAMNQICTLRKAGKSCDI